jgi:hypothetical protein
MLKSITATRPLNKMRDLLLIIIVMVPVVLYYWIFTDTSVNIPHWDDYFAVLEFLAVYLNADTLSGKIGSIISQHNEHRVVVLKIFTILDYHLFGKVDFRHLILAGNLCLIGIFWVLIRMLNIQKHRLLYLIPVPFILFHLQYYGGSNWAIVCTTMFVSTLFAFLSMYFLTTGKQSHLIWAAAFAILATFSNGNGMFTFVSGWVVFFFQRKRPLYQPVVWTTVMLFTIALYFYGYEKQPSQTLGRETLLTDPLLVVRYLTAFTGASFVGLARNSGVLIACQVGLIYWVFYVFLLLFEHDYHQKDPLPIALLTFLFLTIFIASLGRANLGIEQAFTSRYKFNCLIITALLYIFIVKRCEIFKRYSYNFFFMIPLIMFYITEFKVCYKQIIGHKEFLISGASSYHQNATGKNLAFYADKSIAMDILEKARQKEFYVLPKY